MEGNTCQWKSESGCTLQDLSAAHGGRKKGEREALKPVGRERDRARTGANGRKEGRPGRLYYSRVIACSSRVRNGL